MDTVLPDEPLNGDQERTLTDGIDEIDVALVGSSSSQCLDGAGETCCEIRVGDAFLLGEIVVERWQAEACADISSHAGEGCLCCFENGGTPSGPRGSREEEHGLI